MKLQDSITEEFNEFSKNYTDDMVACVPHYLKLLNGFADNLPEASNPQHILDLGCGNGNVTDRLLKRFPKAHYTLLDASDKMLGLCQKQFGQYNITTVRSYFQDFEFESNRFDMIAAGFSLHHCDQGEKKSLFKGIHESLTKGGVFACSDLMIDKAQKEHPQHIKTWRVFVHSNYSDSKKWDWLMDHYNAYDNPDNLSNQLAWLKDAGFKNFQVSVHDNYWVHFKAFKE